MFARATKKSKTRAASEGIVRAAWCFRVLAVVCACLWERAIPVKASAVGLALFAGMASSHWPGGIVDDAAFGYPPPRPAAPPWFAAAVHLKVPHRSIRANRPGVP